MAGTQAQPEPIAAPEVVADDSVYIFKARSAKNIDGFLEKQETRRLLEDSGLLDCIRSYGRAIEPCMYSLIDYMPNIMPMGDTVFGGQERAARLDAGHGVYMVVEDGDAAVYHGDTRLWHTDTVGSGGSALEVSDAGRLMLVDVDGRELWGAGLEDPAAKAPFKCQLRGDGNLCVLDRRNMIVWDSKSGVAGLVHGAQRREHEATLYDMSQQHLLSMRAITAMRPTDVASAFRLDPNMEKPAQRVGAVTGVGASEAPGPGPGPGTGAGAGEAGQSEKRKKEKKSKKEKKHKKEKQSKDG